MAKTSRLRVKNLGPLREAEIDLSRRLIVLTGPNNSGKTWLAWCVYGLATLPVEPFYETVRPFAEELLKSPRRRLSAARTVAFWRAVGAAVPSALKAWLPTLFALPESYFAETKIEVDLDSSESVHATLMFFASGKHESVLAIKLDGKGLSLTLTPRPIDGSAVAARQPTDTLPSLEDTIDALLRALRAFFFPRATIFPAERAGVQLLARELAADRSSRFNDILIRAQAPHQLPLDLGAGVALPLPIVDFQRLSLQPGRPAKQASRLSHLASLIEDRMLAGSLTFHRDRGVTLTPRGTERSLPITASASITKSLAALVQHLRSAGATRGTLIVDEPELNVHPDQQLLLARVLVEIATHDVPVIVSTHSDYILREFNHCIMAAHPSPEAKKAATELGYTKGQRIKPRDVGAYFLHDGGCESLPMHATGFQVPSIDAVVEQQNLTAQRFYGAIDSAATEATELDAT